MPFVPQPRFGLVQRFQPDLRAGAALLAWTPGHERDS
jgi:hypothetical protein